MAEATVELQDGMRVRVKDSMLYTGRVGTLSPGSYSDEGGWDFSVELDPTDDPEVDSLIRGSRTIGVFDFQVEPIEG